MCVFYLRVYRITSVTCGTLGLRDNFGVGERGGECEKKYNNLYDKKGLACFCASGCVCVCVCVVCMLCVYACVAILRLDFVGDIKHV
jgi:hypothetical protein